MTTNREVEVETEAVSTDRVARHYNRNPDRPSCSARSRRTGGPCNNPPHATTHPMQQPTPCNNPPIHGTTVCRMHGGSAPQVKAAARVRIERAADRMAKELLGIAADEGTPPAVRLAAICDALDRSGLGAKTAVEVSVGPQKPWEVVFEDLAGGAAPRAEPRADSPATRS
mgnify:CR=1 FL=1